MGARRRYVSAIVTILQVVGLSILISLSHNGPQAKAQGSIDITGTVTNSSNGDLANVTVYATAPGTDNVDYGPVTTNSNGYYDLQVEAGTYDFHYDPANGSGLNSVVDSDVTVFNDQTIDIVLAPSTYNISGTFTDNSGNPITNTHIFLDGLNSGASAYATSTDGNGNYSLNVSPDQYDMTPVTFSDGGLSGTLVDQNSNNYPINATSSNAVQNLQLNTVTVNVVVKDSNGNPVPNAEATVNALPGEGSTSLLAGQPATWTAQGTISDSSSDPSGTVTLTALSGLEYQICGTDPSTGTEACVSDVTITGNNTTVDITLSSTYNISGTFTDNSGNPITNTHIFLDGLNSGASAYATSTDGNGNYSLNVSPDQYDMTPVTFSDGGLSGTLVDQNSNNYPINATSSNAVQNLQLNTVTVNVVVKDSNGNPVPNAEATVNALPGEGSTSLLAGQPATWTAQGTISDSSSDPSGTVTLTALSGLEYQICGTDPSTGTEACVSDVTITGNNTTVDITLSSTYNISGTFTDNSGNPITNTHIFLDGLNSGASAYATSTDGNGNYSLNVSPDQYDMTPVTFSDGGLSGTLVDQNSNNYPINATSSNAVQNLQLNTVTVNVVVKDSNGNPVPNAEATVNALPGEGSTSLLAGQPATWTAQGTISDSSSDPSGTVTLTALSGLEYQICGTDPSTGTEACVSDVTITGNNTTVIVQEVSPTPSAPTGLSATTPTNQAPALTWNSVSGSTSYNIYRNGTDIGSSTSTNYTDSSLSSNGTYSYSVTAVNSSGESAQSNPVSVVYDTTPPVVTITGITNGETYNTSVTPVCNASDSLSGVATNASLSITNSGLSYTATCSGAVDNAGNAAASVSVTYTQLPSNYTLVNLVNSTGGGLSNSKVVFRTPSGTVGTTYTDSFGNTYLNTTPGTTYTATVYYANGYVNETINPTSGGPNTVDVTTIPVTVTINDPSVSDIANASVAQAGNTGTFGSKVPVNSSGQVVFQVLPGTSYFTAYDANGYLEQSLVVSPTNNTVTVNTDTVTVTVTKNGIPLTTATVDQAGNSGSYGSKMAVNSNGQITFNVLPGTNYFAAFDGSNYTKETLNVTGDTTTTISVE